MFGVVLVSLLLTLKIFGVVLMSLLLFFTPCSCVSFVNFEHAIIVPLHILNLMDPQKDFSITEQKLNQCILYVGGWRANFTTPYFFF